MKALYYQFTIPVLLLLIVSGTSCIPHSTPEKLPVIELSPHIADNRFIFEDVFQSVEIIPLETHPECLLGGITKLQEADENYFILDGRNNILAKFNDDGKFITKIGREGNGPGEYLKIEDFILDKKNENIILYDIKGRKIIIYDFSGIFIREFAVDFFIQSIALAERWVLLGIFRECYQLKKYYWQSRRTKIYKI